MRLIILGAGGYGHTVADLAEQSGKYSEIKMLDDAGTVKCEAFMQFRNEETVFYPAFGNNELRLRWLKRLEEAGCAVCTLIHPTAYVSPTAKIEAGVVVLPKAVVNTGCTVRSGCIVNCGAIVDHGCVLECGVHVCLGAIVKGENHLPACLKVEASVVIPNGCYPL